MNTQKIKETIHQYFDNELSKGEEVMLFSQLSDNEDAREYFKQMNLLRTTTDLSIEDYPEELDVKIISNLKEEKSTFPFFRDSAKMFTTISYVLAVILLVLSIFFYNESMQYKNKLELTYQRVNQQNQMIKVLFNSLPQTEVKGNLNNEIVVTAKM